MNKKTKIILRWFFCIPKEYDVTKLDVQIMAYQFVGSVLVGGLSVYRCSGRI